MSVDMSEVAHDVARALLDCPQSPPAVSKEQQDWVHAAWPTSSDLEPFLEPCRTLHASHESLVSFWTRYGPRFAHYWENLGSEARHRTVQLCAGNKRHALGEDPLVPELAAPNLCQDAATLLGMCRSRCVADLATRRRFQDEDFSLVAELCAAGRLRYPSDFAGARRIYFRDRRFTCGITQVRVTEVADDELKAAHLAFLRAKSIPTQLRVAVPGFLWERTQQRQRVVLSVLADLADAFLASMVDGDPTASLPRRSPTQASPCHVAAGATEHGELTTTGWDPSAHHAAALSKKLQKRLARQAYSAERKEARRRQKAESRAQGEESSQAQGQGPPEEARDGDPDAVAARSEARQRTYTCRICGGTVAPGSEIFDISRKTEPGFIWAHFLCVTGDNVRRPSCRHWTRRGSCAFGSSCFFSHDAPAATLPTEGGRGASGFHTGPPLPHAERLPLPKGTQAGSLASRAKVNKTGRQGHLRRFLLDTFGPERLQSGSGVLDVAGGKGELAFELLNLHGVRATVVEPRPLRLDSVVRRYDSRVYWNNQHPAFTRHLVPSPRDASAAFPGHLRVLFDAELVRWVDHAEDHASVDVLQSWLDMAVARAREASTLYQGHEQQAVLDEPAVADFACTACEACKPYEKCAACVPCFEVGAFQVARPLAYPLWPSAHESDDSTPASGSTAGGSVRECPWGGETTQSAAPDSSAGTGQASALVIAGDGEPITAGAAALDVLRRASCVVGMHPDQATEAIVDLALALGTGFAVVPCCVHAGEFPNRKTKGGDPVQSYNEFLDYLQGKNPRIQRAALPFEGRNTVLWLAPSERDGVVMPQPLADTECMISRLVALEVARRGDKGED
ncbi:hypothetical protein CYMTET_11271 [Cymbomonas tetramitiformis]|uniref:C3H1-type domain-containing protein n=1 Tax=Cymbomonas tetramitiformis TaxID=36881 RepID=A0AAE0GML4_9CHLO|nr:hypothetical protein CYMTET_11271 [Cymbomonas tetramitiformis]